MTYITYQNNLRTINGLLGFEKTILEYLFQMYGDLEKDYRQVQEDLRRKFRIKVCDFVEIIECLSKLGYIDKIGGKRHSTIRVIKID